MKTSHRTRKGIPWTVELLADCFVCMCLRGENSMFHLKPCFSVLLPLLLLLFPCLTLLHAPLLAIYTCQDVAIKPKSLYRIFYYETICIPERKINPTFPWTALGLRFGDLFRLITLSNADVTGKITRPSFCLPHSLACFLS